MAPYKILHIIGGGELGGAEQHVLTLFSALSPERFDLSLACLVDGPLMEYAAQHHIPAGCFPMRGPLDLRPTASLVQWGRSRGIQLFHTHGSRAHLLGRRAAHKLGIPCVSTVHSSLRHDYLSPLQAHIALMLDRLTLPLTSGIITVSDYLNAEVRARGGKNVHTIYNGINWDRAADLSDPSVAERQRRHYRTLWNIPQDALVLGTIARLHPTKGHRYLIEAARRLLPCYPNLHLLLLGEGPLRAKLETQLAAAHVPYTMPGFILQGAQALPGMDLFILPSISEGMGLVLLEAIHARIPIVATTVGGIGEIVRSGKDALLVPPADPAALAEACRTLLQKPEQACQLTQSALSRLGLFSVQRMAEQTGEFYRQILSQA